jgi:hypothetical protein
MSDTRAELLSAFDEFRDALKTCDTRTLDALMAPDYRSYNMRGELEEREVVLEAYSPGNATLEEWEMEDLQVELFAEVGILSGKGYLAGHWQGHPWSHHLRFVDIWILRDGRWQVLLSQATEMEESPPKE